MEIKLILSTQTVDQFNLLSIDQTTDSPHTDSESTLSSAASNEKGCCSLIFDVFKSFVDWIISFFCNTMTENLETIEGIKEHMSRMDACFEQEDGPVVLLKDFTRITLLILQNNDFSDFFLATINREDFSNNRAVKFYKKINAHCEIVSQNCANNVSFENYEFLDSQWMITEISPKNETVRKEVIDLVNDFNIQLKQHFLQSLYTTLYDEYIDLFRSSYASPYRVLNTIVNLYITHEDMMPRNALSVMIDMLNVTPNLPNTPHLILFRELSSKLLANGTLNFDECIAQMQISHAEIDEVPIRFEILKFNQRKNQDIDQLYQAIQTELPFLLLTNSPVERIVDLIISFYETHTINNWLFIIIDILQKRPNLLATEGRFILIGQHLLNTGKLDTSQFLGTILESYTIESVKSSFIQFYNEFNDKEPKALAAKYEELTALLQRQSSEEYSNSIFSREGLINLVNGLISYFSKKLDPKIFPYFSKTLHSELDMLCNILASGKIPSTRFTKVYYKLAIELIRTGKLNEQQIMQECNPSGEIRVKLESAIHKFNQQE